MSGRWTSKQHEVRGILRGELQPETAGGRRDELDPRMPFQDTFEKGEVRRVVLDVEDPSGRKPDRLLDGLGYINGLVHRGLDGVELDPEGRTDTDLAVESDRTAHRLDHTLGQGETNPGPFDLRLLRSEALERSEDRVLLVQTGFPDRCPRRSA